MTIQRTWSFVTKQNNEKDIDRALAEQNAYNKQWWKDQRDQIGDDDMKRFEDAWPAQVEHASLPLAGGPQDYELVLVPTTANMVKRQVD